MKMKTSVRVEEGFYKEAKEVFERFGLTFTDAINLFLAKVAIDKGIPFDLKLPSEELNKRIKNLEQNESVITYNDSKELFDDLGI